MTPIAAPHDRHRLSADPWPGQPAPETTVVIPRPPGHARPAPPAGPTWSQAHWTPAAPLPAGADPYRRARRRWMLAGVGIVAATAATVGLLAVTVSGSQSGTRTSGSDAGVPVPPLPTKSSPVPRTPASTVDDAALPALLPDAATLAQIMGAAALTEVPDLSGPQLFTDTSDPAQCVGIAIPGARGAYAGTSWRSTYTQTLKDPAGSRSPHMVFNTVTTFPTAAAAADFTTRQLGVWQDCQGIPITTNPGDHAMTWNARDVARGRSLTATIQPQNSDVICQRALTAVQNTVVDVQACSLDVTNEAEVITTTIAARIHP